VGHSRGRQGSAPHHGTGQLAAVAGFALYVVGGWISLTFLVSGHEATPAPPPRRESPSARVTVAINVIDRTTLLCITSVDSVTTNTIVAEASEVPELLRDLNCRNDDT
jgi:hypothetical protein